MEIKILDRNTPDFDRISEINCEAFPDNERMPLDKIFSFSPITDVIGIYENEKIIGFSMLIKGNKCAYIYFLAIDSAYRGMGFGSAALKMILEKYSDYQLVLDFEVLDEKADNYTQRVRRKQFYLANGFHETGRYTFLGGERFEAVCSESELDENGLFEIISHIHERVPEFAEYIE